MSKNKYSQSQDITFCSNDRCPLYSKCFRNLGNATQLYISVSHFHFDVDEKSGDVECNYFIDNGQDVEENG